MRQVHFKGEIKNAHNNKLANLKTRSGESLPATLEYETSFQAFGPDKNPKGYTDADWDAALKEMEAAGVVLTPQDKVNAGNGKRKASARTKAINAKLDDMGVIKPTAENDPQFRLKIVYDALIAGLKPEEREDPAKVKEARDMASTATGVQFTDDEDDE